MATDSQPELPLEALSALEPRLAQAEFYITGGPEYTDTDTDNNTDAPSQPRKPAHGESPEERLKRLEQRLRELRAENRTAGEMLDLHTSHPELFPSDLLPPSQSSYTVSEKYDILNSSAALFASTASRLTAINDTPVPPTEVFSQLSSLAPQLAKVELGLEQRLEEVAALRLRTTMLFQRWAELGVIGGNECWVEWQERLMECEKVVRRREGKREREKEPV